jgi:multidrug efflux pump subunit AcrB
VIRAIARWSVGNSLAVNLGTVSVLVVGVFAYLGMPKEVFPEFSLGTVTVTTVYPGAGPEDVERLVSLPLEEELEGIDGVREYSSVSQEGLSIITLTTHVGTDMQVFMDDVRAAVQGGDYELPEEAEDPRVNEIKSEFPAIAVFIYGHGSQGELRRIAEANERVLERIPGVSQVILQGVREPRIWVEVDPAAFDAYGLTLADVGRAVGARVSDVPLGGLTTAAGDFLLRLESGVERAEDLREAPVLARPDGTLVRLSEVARVVDSYERVTASSRFNGQPAIYLRVNKQADGDAIEISKAVFEHIEVERERMPPGIAIGANSDLSVYIKNRLRVMTDSASLGGIFVLVALVLFLNKRVAGMTALGIPVSFLGGLAIAGMVGVSMNMMTMFALIVVLGMVVDDAIVVGENVFRLMEEGHSPREAAIRGTAEVGAPVMVTIMTTVAAFLPTLMIGGTMGKFMRPLPLIVTFCLFASLVEALIVLPSHLAHWTSQRSIAASAGSDRWYEPVRRVYDAFLARALEWRYVTFAATATLLVLVITFAVERLPYTLFDDFESKVFSINVRATPGTPIRETERIAFELEESLLDLPEHELESTNSVAGVSYIDATRYSIGQHLGQVWVELREDSTGRRPTSEIIEELRERYRVPPPGVESLDVTQPQAGPAGRAIDIAVRGPDSRVLEELADELQQQLRGMAGVRDVHDDWEPGKREVRLRLTDAGRSYGFDEALLASEMRAAFEGTRWASVRRGKDDVEVVVKLPEEAREERGMLERLWVGLPAGVDAGAAAAAAGVDPDRRRVPLGLVAELEERPGPSAISRDDGERSIRVMADVNKAEGNAREITAKILADWADLPRERPGYSLEFKGEHQDNAESMAGLTRSLLVAVLVIYLILATFFRSLLQPLVIMLAIPFGALGMILGHWLMGRPLSFLSLMGFVALAGIVVNDSLILIQFVNLRRREGMDLFAALRLAGRQRFRPILLTSITTMLGLSPLAMFATGQARFLQPMAITIFFGLAFSTVLILIVIPSVYAIVEDVVVLARHPLRSLASLRRGEPVHPRTPQPVEATP